MATPHPANKFKASVSSKIKKKKKETIEPLHLKGKQTNQKCTAGHFCNCL